MREQLENLPSGIHYLIPLRCWESIQETQSGFLDQKQQKKVPTIRESIQTFHFDYQEHLERELKTKSNLFTLHQLIITPKIKLNRRWKIVHQEDWNNYKHYLGQENSIPIIYDQKNPDQYFTDQLVEVRIVFCSETRYEAYVGFVPLRMKADQIVTEMGTMMGFLNFQSSSVYYADLVESLNFSYLQILQARELEGSLLQIRGLVHNSEIQFHPYSSQPKQFAPNAPRHDFRRYEREIQPQSLTTKVDTPRQQPLEQYPEMSRINKKLFLNSGPQILKQQRQRAKQSMRSTIPIPQMNEENAELMLYNLARQCLQRIKKSDHEEFSGTDSNF